MARPDIVAVVHTHSLAVLAVSAQKHGLLPITQQVMRFYNRIACYPNEVDAVAGGAQLIIPAPEACVKKFGRIAVYDSKSRDWVAGMALVQKLFPDYQD